MGGRGRKVRLGLALAVTVVFSTGVVSLALRSGSGGGTVRYLTAPWSGSAAPAAAAVAGGPPPQGAALLGGWAANAARVMDGVTLAAAGIDLPEGANVFAARIFGGDPSPAYQFYEAGGGAFADGFYPASAVKLLAALGALELAASLGFTGAATVNNGYTLREMYDAAIRTSSNSDYDELVRIAGADWLNQVFLPAHGYTATVIEESLGGYDVLYSPAMVLTEGDRVVEVPERQATGSYGCDGYNCSSLFELADSVRRVVLDAELPDEERFAIAPDDIVGLQAALLGADAWITPGVYEALGPDALVFAKPGYVGGLDCVDEAVVAEPGSGSRYLIALSVPDDMGCEVLPSLAADVIAVLGAADDGPALRTDGSLVAVVDGHQTAS